MLGWQLGTALPELPEDQEKGSQKSGVRRRERRKGLTLGSQDTRDCDNCSPERKQYGKESAKPKGSLGKELSRDT